MADEDSDEWVEDEILVVAELNGVIDPDIVKKENLRCHVLGMDTERPMLQLDNYLFSGEYEDAIGTDLIYKVNPLDAADPDGGVRDVEYQCLTKKRLIMKRTFLQNKNIPDAAGQSGAGDEEGETSEGREEEFDLDLSDTADAAPAPPPAEVVITSTTKVIHSHKSSNS